MVGTTVAPMPARPCPAPTRTTPAARRRPIALLALGVAAVLLVGCGQQRDPTSYTSGVKDNFVHGCERGVRADPTEAQLKASNEVCQCVIEKITRSPDAGGVPFHEFSAAESKIRTDPQKYTIDKVLPQALVFLDECEGKAPPTTVGVGPVAPTTTAKAGATTVAPTTTAHSTTTASN